MVHTGLPEKLMPVGCCACRARRGRREHRARPARRRLAAWPATLALAVGFVIVGSLCAFGAQGGWTATGDIFGLPYFADAVLSWQENGYVDAGSSIIIRGGDYVRGYEAVYDEVFGLVPHDSRMGSAAGSDSGRGLPIFTGEGGEEYRDYRPPVVTQLTDDFGVTKAGSVLIWDTEETILEWEFEVEESAIYEMRLTYMPLSTWDGELIGKGSTIQREIRIDGEIPFFEARNIVLTRLFRDSEIAPGKEFDALGNQVRPKPVEVFRWSTVAVEDGDATYNTPLRFYLEKGKHTLSIRALREPMALAAIELVPPTKLPAYEELAARYAQEGFKEVEGAFIKWQAENAAFKSHTTVRMEHSSYPTVEPASSGEIVFNVFGDWRWRNAHEYAEWEFEVPESGLYKLCMKVEMYTTWGGGLPSHREIRIDGEVPFEELRAYAFDNRRDWRIETIGYYASENDARAGKKTPYLFYLEKGKHTLRMTTKMGDVGETIRRISDLIQQLSDIVQDVRVFVGLDPDPNRDYSVHLRIPDLLDRMRAAVDILRSEEIRVRSLTSEFPPIAGTMAEMIAEIEDMIDDPESIPVKLNSLTEKIYSLSQLQLDIRQQPIKIDYMYAADPDHEDPKVLASLWARLKAAWNSFYQSFFKDYNKLTKIPESGVGDAQVIEVWVAYGREWANVLREMIEDDFTPKTGIYVDINLVPGGAMGSANSPVMLAAIAGRAPDVVIGVSGEQPVEYAIRGALEPLDDKPGFEEVISRFTPGAMIPYEYQGHYYAIPERQDFQMMFVRTDILETYGLEIPDTWEDVYRLIPRLKAHELEFYYPPGLNIQQVAMYGGGFTPFLFQNGGEYYTPDGLRSGLDTPEAFRAFQQWTGLYTNYKLEREANAYMRFRMGDMPIIVSGYMTYVILTAAAPELAGRWEMWPMPGTRNAEGVTERWTGGSAQVSVLFNQEHVEGPDDDPELSKARTLAGWEFIKWWASAEVQARFGNEMEAYMGPEGRWNTANVEAMKELPWRKRDLQAILAQWHWFKQQPVVLGGYFTGRHLTNAWNRVVLQGWKVRDALDEAVEYINRELRKKQIEFGINPEDGLD